MKIVPNFHLLNLPTVRFSNVHLGCQSYKQVLYMSFVTNKWWFFRYPLILQRILVRSPRPPKEPGNCPSTGWIRLAIWSNLPTSSPSILGPKKKTLVETRRSRAGCFFDFFLGSIFWGVYEWFVCLFFWGWGHFVNLVFWGVLMFLWCSWIRSWWCWHTKW